MKTTLLLLGLPTAYAAVGDSCSVGTNGAAMAWAAGAKDGDGNALTDVTKKQAQEYFDSELGVAPLQNPPVIMACASTTGTLASINVLKAIGLDTSPGTDGDTCTTATCSCYSASIAASVSIHQFAEDAGPDGAPPGDVKSTGVTYAGILTADMYACGKRYDKVAGSMSQEACSPADDCVGKEVFSSDADATDLVDTTDTLKCYTTTGTDNGLSDEGTIDGVKASFAFERCVCNSVSDTAICNNADKGVAQEPVPCTPADVGVKEGCLAVGDDVKVKCTQAMEDDATDKNCATGSTGKTVVVQQPASGVAAGTDNAKAPAAKAPGSNGNGASSATVGYSMLVVAAAVALKA